MMDYYVIRKEGLGYFETWDGCDVFTDSIRKAATFSLDEAVIQTEVDLDEDGAWIIEELPEYLFLERMQSPKLLEATE